MKKQLSDEIPFDPTKFQDSQSQMFRIDESGERDISNVPFFDKNTQITKPGQRRIVVYANLEEERRSFYEIMTPYIRNMAMATGTVATQAGQGVFKVMKNGFWWCYDKMVNTVIPYTTQELPKILFVVTKKREKKDFQATDEFCVLEMDDDQYNSLGKNSKQKDKIKVIIPLGEKDPQFQEFLRRENFVEKYSFPIDMDDDDQDQQVPVESYMIPSESFEVLYDAAVHEGYKFPEKQKVVYRMKDCAIFELEGKNTIEYDLLDQIQMHNKSQSGYIVIPDKVLKKASSDIPSEDADCPLETVEISKPKLQKVEEPAKQEIQMEELHEKKKVVDGARKVRVQLPAQESVQKREKKLEYA